LYFNFFSAPFARRFCLRVLQHLSVRKFSLFFVFNYCIWPICCNFSLSLSVYCFIIIIIIIIMMLGYTPVSCVPAEFPQYILSRTSL
jgi:hypothetical protein